MDRNNAKPVFDSPHCVCGEARDQKRYARRQTGQRLRRRQGHASSGIAGIARGFRDRRWFERPANYKRGESGY